MTNKSFVSSHFPSGLLRAEADAQQKAMEIDQESKSNNALNNVSRELIWQCIGKYNCFLRKNLNGTKLSAEKGNLYNEHKMIYSGLANNRTIDIQDGGDCVEVTLKRTKPGSQIQPAKMYTSYTIKKPTRRGQVGLQKKSMRYRKELSNDAVRRMSAIARSQRKIKAEARSS
eukprot:TRINITY_DN12042_c0_g2_i1.p2 TRINITY_DN12042_c0_g2~~TRINITY_DN12042_c0_g2_i1.p2  ORF type:complete len:184 (+),score=7.35 TRINITY_DN12042_c0_g2_i1:39-554(+)